MSSMFANNLYKTSLNPLWHCYKKIKKNATLALSVILFIYKSVQGSCGMDQIDYYYFIIILPFERLVMNKVFLFLD